MIGQFDYRPSQRLALVLGIATLKSSGKMCLITDLSAPHNDKAWSINGLIPLALFSLFQASVDDAIKFIKKAGRGIYLVLNGERECISQLDSPSVVTQKH